MKRLGNGNTGYTRDTSKERVALCSISKADGSSMIRSPAGKAGWPSMSLFLAANTWISYPPPIPTLFTLLPLCIDFAFPRCERFRSTFQFIPNSSIRRRHPGKKQISRKRSFSLIGRNSTIARQFSTLSFFVYLIGAVGNGNYGSWTWAMTHQNPRSLQLAKKVTERTHNIRIRTISGSRDGYTLTPQSDDRICRNRPPFNGI